MINFTQIPNEILRDENLSWQAKGLLCYLLSHKDTWKISLRDTIKKAKNGQRSVYSIISELIVAGYLIKTVNRVNGKFTETVYTPQFPPKRQEISFGSCLSKDQKAPPFGGNADMENPYMDSSDMENQTPNNTNLNKTKLENTNLHNNFLSEKSVKKIEIGNNASINISPDFLAEPKNGEQKNDIDLDEFLLEEEEQPKDNQLPLLPNEKTSLQLRIERAQGKPLSEITYNVLFLHAAGLLGSKKLGEVRMRNVSAEKLIKTAQKVFSFWPNPNKKEASIQILVKELTWLTRLCRKLRQPEKENPVATDEDLLHVYKVVLLPLLKVLETRKENFSLTPKIPDCFYFFRERKYWVDPVYFVFTSPKKPKNFIPRTRTITDNPLG